MGSYTFQWQHPAEEVYVTGTFDNWTKSVQLEKEGDVFQKKVDLKADEKIYYKFVVDGTWTTNESSPKEPDHEGNINNFLTPTDITKSAAVAAILNTVTPSSTTAKMAGEQPKEPAGTPSEAPGAFPATPADELDKPVGVKPLPAADGAVNPITLAPGEKIPGTISAQSTDEHVKLDKESYEKSDALAGVDLSLPPVTSNTIPESSLPMGGNKPVTVNTVGPGSTTAALAGQVPLESKVPGVVKESQDKAGVDPEASAVAAEVKDKAKVEDELKEKVPEAPSTAEGTSGVGTEKKENTGGILAAAATAGGAVAAAALAAKDSLTEKATPAVNQATVAATDAANKNLPDSVKEKLPVAAQETLAAQNKEETREEVSPAVPSEVKESITEAGKSPEAAGSTSAVADKAVMEAELKKEVKTVPADGEAKPEAAKTEATKTEATKTEAVKESTPANGADSKPTEAAAGTSNGTESAADKKKKNRLSTMFSKIKHKLSDK